MSLPASVSKCPGCNKPPTKTTDKQCVACRTCSKRLRRVYQYCRTCQREWPSQSSTEDACTLPNCALRSALLSSQRINNPRSSVNGCPYFRACPSCKALLTHTGDGCPNIVCPGCRTGFCFRCLRQNCFGAFVPEVVLRDVRDGIVHLLRDHRIEPCITVDNQQILTAISTAI